MKNRIVYIFMALAVMWSCNTTHRLPFSSHALEPVTESMLVSKIAETGNSERYTQITRFSAEYAGMQETQSFKGFVRIAQDSLLMLSLSPAIGGEAFRLLLSPDTSRSLNRLEKIYEVSNYEVASQMIPLPYDLVEALFSYRFDPIITKDFQLSISDGMYHFEDKKHKAHYTSIKVDRQFLVRKLHYKDFNANANVRVSYQSFLEHNDKLFPQEIEIHIQKANQLAVLRISVKKVDFKEQLSFPFHVNSQYIRVAK